LGVNRKTVLGAVDAGVLTGWLAPPVRGRRANANFIFTFGQEVPPDGTSRTDQEVPPDGTSRTDQEVRPGELRSTAFCVKKSVKKEAYVAEPKTSTGHGHLTGKENGQSRAREEEAGKKKGDTRADPRAEPNGRGLGDLLEELLKAANGNVARDARGNVVYGIGQLEPILLLINSDRCSFRADVLPAVTELVPTLTEPLPTWNDSRIRDACIARRRTREAATTQQQRRP